MGLRMYLLGLFVFLTIAKAAAGIKLYSGNDLYMLDHPYDIFNADPVNQYADALDDDLFQARKGDDDEDDGSELDHSKLKKKSLGKNIVAVGSSLNNMAALVPASPAILQAAGVNPRHIIGYIPVSSPDGNALVFPTGAIRVIGNEFDNDDEEEEDEEERGIGNRKNPLKKYTKRRKNTNRNYNRRKSTSRKGVYRPHSGRTRSKSKSSSRYSNRRRNRRKHSYRYRLNRY